MKKNVNRILLLISLLISINCLNCLAEGDFNSCLSADKYSNPNSYDKELFNKIINREKKITYECFGAKGDGSKNDYAAINKAHEFANKIYTDSSVLDSKGKPILLTVYGTKGSTYYIGKTGAKNPPIYVYTHVDWQNANFIIEDYKDMFKNEELTNSELYRSIFVITSPLQTSGTAYIEYSGSNNNVVKKFSSLGTSTTSLKFNIY